MATVTLFSLSPDHPSLEGHACSEPLVVCRDPEELGAIVRDAAAMDGSGASGLVVPGSEAQLGRWLRDNPGVPVLAQGALTSLTGGATPSDDIVVSLRRMTSLQVQAQALRATAGAGLILANLQEALSDQNLYYPPAPTHDGASIGGNVSTNAAGAATFKYGTTRDWVERVRLVLRHGDVLELRRGEHSLMPGDRLRIEGSRVIEVAMPDYESPPLKKSSAGYFVRTPWDPIDLFIGSEGTLGIVTEVEVRLVLRPRVLTGLVFLDSVARTMALVETLRAISLRTRADGGDGLDVRSIEYFDAGCLAMLRAEGKLSEHGVDVPDDAAACLLFEQEVPEYASDDGIVERLVAVHEGGEVGGDAVGTLMRVLVDHDLVDRTELALPGDARRKRQLAAVREAIPLSISDRLRALHSKDPRVHKVAGDMIVPFDRFEQMLGRYVEAFRSRGVDVVIFGHISDGNVHPNALPRDASDMDRAKEALLSLAGEAKLFGGCPLSEHGVGKHPLKKRMLEEYWGQEVIRAMRGIKTGFDPDWTLGRGVFFEPPEEST
jgi:D-lactate dehydrogenase (cytochrome)